MSHSATDNSVPAPASPRGAHGIVLVLLTVVVVAATCWPVFRTPQLAPDDYRYLHLTQELDENFWRNLPAASLVTNRWDHVWFMNVPQQVHFFRPIVALSYWLDVKLYGREHVAAGLAVTNVLIYSACCLLVGLLLRRWFGVGHASLLGALLFAAMACHAEVIWYIAGRTDSLAALGFLAALVLHTTASGRRRWLAVPAFGFALLSKELTICLPVVCFLYDAWIADGGGGYRRAVRRNVGLYAGYVAVLLVVGALRFAALHGHETTLVFPYFVSPLRADFPHYLGLQLRSYAENLLYGNPSPPLVSMSQIAATLTWPGLIASGVAAAAAGVVAYADRRARLLLVMALLTWLPASVVYLSERYLLLPSVAVCGLLVSALARLDHVWQDPVAQRVPLAACPPVRGNTGEQAASGALAAGKTRAIRAFAGAFVIIWIGWQGLILFAKTTAFTKPRATQRTDQRLAAMRDQIPRGAEVLLLNLPGDWLGAQFAEDQLRWTLDDPTLSVYVVTLISRDQYHDAVPRPHWLADNRFSLECRESASQPSDEHAAAESPLADNRKNPFDTAPFTPGEMINGDRLGFVVRITAGHDGVCTGAQFTLPKPVEHYTFVDLVDPVGVITPTRQSLP